MLHLRILLFIKRKTRVHLHDQEQKSMFSHEIKVNEQEMEKRLSNFFKNYHGYFIEPVGRIYKKLVCKSYYFY